MMFELTNDEKLRLQRLNTQKEVIIALKKLFLNACFEKPLEGGVQELAAERIAQHIIRKAFHHLSTIVPDNSTGQSETNLI